MKNLFTIFLISTFLIVSCVNQSNAKQKEVNIFVGTDGLSEEFSKTAPPPRVFEDSSFPILLTIRNSGASSIKDKAGILSIGREKDYVTSISVEENGRVSKGSQDQAKFDVEGKTQINPKGDNIIVTLNAKTGKLEPQSEYKESTITSTLCYPYKTILSTTVCIDPDISGMRPTKPEGKVCKVQEMVFNSGQGSPIAVTKIEPNMIPEEGDIIKPQFLIFIENKGRGNPVDINNYQNVCGKSDFSDGTRLTGSNNIWNVARLKAFHSGKEGENQLECTPNMENSNDKTTGFIRFRDKKDFVRCTFKKSIKRTDDAFTSPLRVEIDFGYVQTISAKTKIQKPLKY